MSRDRTKGIGPQVYAETRVILDLTDALGTPPHVTARTQGGCVTQFAELLQHRRGIGRPADLGDDLAFIEAACGRRSYADARVPVLQ